MYKEHNKSKTRILDYKPAELTYYNNLLFHPHTPNWRS